MYFFFIFHIITGNFNLTVTDDRPYGCHRWQDLSSVFVQSQINKVGESLRVVGEGRKGQEEKASVCTYTPPCLEAKSCLFDSCLQLFKLKSLSLAGEVWGISICKLREVNIMYPQFKGRVPTVDSYHVSYL